MATQLLLYDFVLACQKKWLGTYTFTMNSKNWDIKRKMIPLLLFIIVFIIQGNPSQSGWYIDHTTTIVTYRPEPNMLYFAYCTMVPWATWPRQRIYGLATTASAIKGSSRDVPSNNSNHCSRVLSPDRVRRSAYR